MGNVDRSGIMQRPFRPQTLESTTRRGARPSALFFRPSPSRLSPGRNTVFVPLNELCKVLYIPALGSRKRAWTSMQSNCPNRGDQRGERPANRTKENKRKPQKTQPKKTKTQETPRSDGRALSKMAAYVPVN